MWTTKRQLRHDLDDEVRLRALAEKELWQAEERIEQLEREIALQHVQIDTLTVFAETSTLNMKLNHLHHVADELLLKGATLIPIQTDVSDDC